MKHFILILLFVPIVLKGQMGPFDTLSFHGNRMVIDAESFVEKSIALQSDEHGNFYKQYFIRPRDMGVHSKTNATSFIVASGYVDMPEFFNVAERLDERSGLRFEKVLARKEGLLFGLRYDRIHNVTFQFTYAFPDELPRIDSLIKRVAWLDSSQLNDIIIDCIDLSIGRCGAAGNDNVYVCKDGLPNDFPYNSLTGITFVPIAPLQLQGNPITKKTRNGMVVLSVSYKLDGNLLLVSISRNTVKQDKKHSLSIASCDKDEYSYRYSDTGNIWELKEASHGNP